MVAIYSDPLGDSIFNRADAATISTIHSNNKILNMSDDSVDKDKTIEHLRKRITQLEAALSQNHATTWELILSPAFIYYRVFIFLSVCYNFLCCTLSIQ